MATARHIRTCSIAVLAAGYLAGLMAFPMLPGPLLAEQLSMRLLVAFTLPTTSLVIYVLFRSLWVHDPVRSGQGARIEWLYDRSCGSHGFNRW